MRNLDKRISLVYFTPNTDNIARYLSDISKYEVLPDKEIKKELKKAQKNDQEAITKIVNSNQRFVFKVAKKFSNGNKDLLADLITEANIGLMTSINKFDRNSNVMFLSYAVYWMQKQVFLYLTFIDPIISVTNKAKTTKVGEIKNKYYLLNGRYPTSDEIIEELEEKYSIQISNEKDLYQMSTISIHSSAITDNYDDFSSYFTANQEGASESSLITMNECEDNMENNYNKMIISSSMGVLTEREQKVINQLYGINNYREYEIQEVAKNLGISREAVRQIKKRALTKLETEIKITEMSI